MSRTGDPIADALLMHAIRLLAQHLSSKTLDADLDARGDLMLAAVLCGQGSDYAAAGITTVVGHAIGASYHMDNGIANAIVLRARAALQCRRGESRPVEGRRGFGRAFVRRRAAGSRSRRSKRCSRSSRSRGDSATSACRAKRCPKSRKRGWATGSCAGNPRPVREASELQQMLEEAW